jgi:6-phosphofructokinase 1
MPSSWSPRAPARNHPQFRRDRSRNARLGDIRGVVEDKSHRILAEQGSPLALKYIDPGYLIRSVPADPHDSVHVRLAQAAVHAGMAGRTEMVVERRHNRFIHVPIKLVISRCNQVAPTATWLSVLSPPRNLSRCCDPLSPARGWLAAGPVP